MEKILMESVVLTKSEVAKRQLKAAIRLFFLEGDTVAIHTLIAASHQILFDLGKPNGIVSAVKNTTRLRQAEMSEVFAAVNYPFNFFKHADRDSQDRINIRPLSRVTQDFIMDSVLMLQQITNDLPIEAKVYWHWFVSKYPEEFDNLPKDGPIAKMQRLKIAEMSFKQISAFIEFNNIIDGLQQS